MSGSLAIINALTKPIAPEAANTFRLGLVLNGTVSAGAWSAGVMDFLFEAMDTWDAARGQPGVPRHRVRLDIAGGASGGGVCTALLARAAPWRFKPVHDPNDPANKDNPFWKVWVDTLDVSAMLGTEDLDGAKPVAQSLLSGKAIDMAGEAILHWTGTAPVNRTWLASPLHILMTLTNLRGVPYSLGLTGAAGGPAASYYVDHSDHILFAFPGNPERRDAHPVADAAAWDEVALFAKATGGFPGGLPPRQLSRVVDDYDWRGIALPGSHDQPGRVVLKQPAWDALPFQINPGDSYRFDCVDGGALNNQPVELVRTALAGLGNTNPRDPNQANAAVILIDPFASLPTCDAPRTQLDVVGVLGGVISAWEAHSRFATSDVLLAADENVFSRFMLTACDTVNGKTTFGGAALATSGLGAFLGFFSRARRTHDFMLGRENCRQFLMEELQIGAANPVLGAGGSASALRPLVPVLGDLAQPRPVPPLVDNFDPETLRGAIKQRAERFLTVLADSHGLSLPGSGLIIDWLLDGKIADLAIQQIDQATTQTATA